MSKRNLFENVVEISRDYFGPAAERFVERQINTHLNKPPKQLDPGDLIILIDWVKLSLALLTDNSRLVDDYVERLSLLARGDIKKALGGQWMAK